MNCRRIVISLWTICACLAPMTSNAQSAADSFAQGKALQAEGQLQPALAAFAAAARADRTNQEYFQQYMTLRQIIELRNRLASERDPKGWRNTANALHSYYFSQAMYPMALELSQQMQAYLKDAQSAVVVAETALAMNKNDVAAQAISALDESQLTPDARALLGVALARQGKSEDAKKIARTIEVSPETGIGTLFSVARLQAASGDGTTAVATLVKCFESTPPSRLETFKQYAQQCSDFASLAGKPAFQQALKTESKIPESKCSGGSSCAGCPMRGKCAHGAQPQQ